MIKNYIKIAWRNIKKDRLFSVVNILGLSVGLAITILLFLFISYEKSYDNMYSKKEQIHRVLLHTEDEGGKEIWANVPSALAPAMTKDIPEVEAAVRMLKHDFGSTAYIKAANNDYEEKELYWTDPEITTIFDMEFLKGNPKEALKDPKTVILSQSISKKYFGEENPIGKQIIVDNRTSLTVTGVYKDFPKNSSISCNIIGAFNTLNFFKNPTWSNASFETFVLLNKNTPSKLVSNKVKQLLNKHVAEKDQWYSFSLQPLERIHLYSSQYKDSYTSRNGSINEVRNLGTLAFLILIIACINYMNLITARSEKRSKDVGINKTMGATVKNLILRFYIETGLITLVAIIIGLIIAIILIPISNNFMGNVLTIKDIFSPHILIALVIIWGVTTLISGSYPAFYLSRFSPKEAVKSSRNKGGASVFIRKGLVVTQFTTSVILIIGVVVIHQQLKYMQNKNLGYNPENVIAISTAALSKNTNDTHLINAFKALPNVSSAAFAQGYPGMGVSGRGLYKNDTDEKGMNIQTNLADSDIVNVLELKLLSGNLLPKIKQKGDTLVDVILNKSAVEYLGYTPEEAIGKKISIQLGDNSYVRGVVDDFNFSSLHTPIGGYAFHNMATEYKSYLLVRFKAEAISEAITTFENTFKNAAPNTAFGYTFLDKNLERMYAQEQKIVRVGLVFSILAIFVACLGLFALAAFTAEQRKKEIGIRKVLGASLIGITKLLSKQFITLVVLALLIGFPLAYWLMDNWLQDFAYRISINWTVFALTAAAALIIAIIAVSSQALKAAIANPVESLKTE
ncbi:ABC transporter permease [Pontimicrobium sp. MEBiC01747]